MSINVPNVEITEFASDVKAEYQASGFKTKKAIRLRNNVVGSTVRFPISSEGIAQQKAIQADVVPMNVSYANAIATLQDWHASEYSDIFSQATINWDERMELVKVCAGAIGRRMDQLVIDQLDLSNPATVVAVGATNFTYVKFREALAGLHQNNAGQNGVYCAISANAEEELMGESNLMSSDFVNQQATNNGGLDGLKLAGVNWMVFGNMTEGGLDLSGTTRKCYMWDKEAVGMGIGIDFRTEINYVAEKLSYLVSSVFKAGAVVVASDAASAKGVARISIDESA